MISVTKIISIASFVRVKEEIMALAKVEGRAVKYAAMLGGKQE